ncbi:MAG: hypothetical protein ACRDZR_02270 [Acidimicrobiales bacterium]
MRPDHVRPVLAQLAGRWPTPALTEEEALAWTADLTGPLHITRDEALGYMRRHSHSGAPHRPRPGEMVAAVRADRRAAARITDTSRMLAAGRSGAVSPERASQWCRALRRVAAGDCDLDAAQRAEGLVPA